MAISPGSVNVPAYTKSPLQLTAAQQAAMTTRISPMPNEGPAVTIGAGVPTSTPGSAQMSLDPLYARNPGISLAGPGPNIATPSIGPVQNATASTAGSESAQAAVGSLGGYTAATGNPSDAAFSANRMNDITKQASPLMQRAKMEGMLTAGRRGLENSSIAAGAAMGAMVDRATPLALQDAQAQFNAEQANLAATNRASEFTAGQKNVGILEGARMENEAASLNAQLQTAVSQGNAAAANAIQTRLAELKTQTSLAGAEMQHQSTLTNANASNQMRSTVLQTNAELNRQFLAGTQAMDLASIQGRYSQLIAANGAASQLYDSYFNSISQTMANKEIDPARVAQTVQIQQTMLEAGLRMVDQMNTLDLGQFELPGAAASGTGMVPTAGGGVTAPNTPPGTAPPAPGSPIGSVPGGTAQNPATPGAPQAAGAPPSAPGTVRGQRSPDGLYIWSGVGSRVKWNKI